MIDGSQDGRAALHHAAYNGHHKLIDILCELGADVHQKTRHGMTCIHLAAQGNQAYSLTYFRAKGLSIDEPDN